jgi:hypothetical protein
MNRAHRLWRPTAMLVLAGLAGALPARADLTFPAGPIVFDEDVSHGFYVDQLDGTTLDSVTLRYFPVGPPIAPFTVTLTARLDWYDGEVVGAPVTQSFFTPIPPGPISVTFDFGGVAVPRATRVTFTQVLDATPLGGTLSFDTGPCTAGDVACMLCPLFYESADTSPPLSKFRRHSVAAVIATSGDFDAVSIPALGLAGRIGLFVALAAAGWIGVRSLKV